MRYLRKLILILLYMILSINLCYAKINIQTSIDRTDLTIGDTFSYKIEISHDTEKIIPPRFAQNLGGFVIRDFNSADNEKTIIYKYILTSYDYGKKQIPEIEIFYIDNNDTKSIKTNALAINIKAVSKESDLKIKDIKKLWDKPKDLKNTYIVLSTLFAVLLIILIIRIILLKRKKKIELEIESSESPEERRARLTKEIREILENFEDSQSTIFADKSVELIKTYILQYYEIDTFKDTSDRFLYTISNFIIQSLIDEIENIIQELDFIRFADQRITKEQAKSLFDNIVKIEVQLKPNKEKDSQARDEENGVS